MAQRRNAVFEFMGTTHPFSSPEPPVPVSRRGLGTRVGPTGPCAQPPAAKRARRLWGQEWLSAAIGTQVITYEEGGDKGEVSWRF